LQLALEHDMEDHAARAFVNLASGGIERRDGTDYERHLLAGLEYCASRELDLQWPYLEGDRALLMVQRGEWQAAEQICSDLLRLPLIPVHRHGVLKPLLLVRIRRGDPYEELLDDAMSVSIALNEPQRTLPILFARAEAAWLAGTLPELRDELAAQREVSDVREDGWRLAELHFWLNKADPSYRPETKPLGAFGVQLTDTPRAAAMAWEALHSPYEAAVALLAGDEADVRRALATFHRLGAEPAARIARTRLRDLGVATIPRGPRLATTLNPFQLTPREDDVLHLLAKDMTNAEIAAQLVLSERTVHHHVSSLLSKLGVPNRSSAATLARTHDYGRPQDGHVALER